MKRREFITLLGGTAAAWPLVAHAQQGEKVHRVGHIATTSPVSELVGPEPVNPAVRAFVQGLRVLGYVEGQSVRTAAQAVGVTLVQTEFLPHQYEDAFARMSAPRPRQSSFRQVRRPTQIELSSQTSRPCAYPRPRLATLRTTMKKMNKKNRSARTSRRPGSSSGRCLARAFHSSESTDTAWMMSSTPRPMPPAKSLARRRGMMQFSMMSFDTASVSVPSKP